MFIRNEIEMFFTRRNIDRVAPSAYGIYFLWLSTNNRCLYIGKAQEQPIKNRLMQHYRDEKNPELAMWFRAFGGKIKFCYLTVDKEASCWKRIIERAETLYIYCWHPKTNKKHQRS